MARIKKKESWWRRIVQEHARSGLSIRDYCVDRRVKEPAFYWWRRELARRHAAPAPQVRAAFVPVVVEPAADRIEGVMIELRGGRMLRLPAMSAAQVAELVRAIEGAA